MSKPFRFAHLIGLNLKAAETPAASAVAETEETEAVPAAAGAAESDAAAATAATAATEAAVSKAVADFRDRCAAIFADKAAAGNVGLACHLAFETDLTAAQAIKALAVAPAPAKGDRLSTAMTTLGNPTIGPDGGSDATTEVATAGWDKAIGRVNTRRGFKAA